MTSEQSPWTPPTMGAPCWIEIPAINVPRAKKFYADVFHWDFKAHGPESKASPDEIATFAFPDPSLEKLSGGIKKVDGQEGKVKEGGPVVYLYVEDLGDVAQKIQEAGGKMVGDKQPEGASGWYQLYEDSEGNVGGVYTLAK